MTCAYRSEFKYLVTHIILECTRVPRVSKGQLPATLDAGIDVVARAKLPNRCKTLIASF